MKTALIKNRPQTLEELAKQTYQQQDPEFTKEYILHKPEKSWQYDKEQNGKNLSYRVYSEIENTSIIPTIEQSMNGFNFMNFQEMKSAELSVVHSAQATRTESLGKGVFGEGFCYIHDAKQGLLYLDKKDKTYLQIEADRMPKLAYDDDFKFTTHEVCAEENDITRITLHFSSPLSIKYVLTIEGNKKYSEFLQKMWCSVVGCNDRFSKAGLNWSQFWQYGIPIGVEIFSNEDKENPERISFVKVNDIKISEGNAELFSIPKGYQDLRDVKKPDKGYTVGKPVRFSTVRNNFTSKQHSANEGKIGVSKQPLSDDKIFIDEGHFRFPSCFPSTYGSLVSNVADQKLLDDLRFIFNAITMRLNGFGGSNGNIDIDWLNQFEAHATSLSGGAGSGLFYLLRDTPSGGIGLLDILSKTEVSKMLVNGDVSTLILPAALSAQITSVIGNAAITPSDRFNNLSSPAQTDLREAYLKQKIANIHLNYPSTTPAQSIFHNLLNVKIYDMDFDIKINNTALMTQLQYEANSTHLHLSLPDASGSAWMLRWPSTTYWAVLIGSGIGCFFFPPACTLFSFAITVGTFLLLDFAYVSIDLKDLEIDAQITFVPDSTTNVLKPSANLTLDAMVTVFYGSVIPTGIHQIVSLIINIVANLTNIVISQIESEAESKLNDFLQKSLALSYPPEFGPVPITSLFNFQEYAANDRFYVETRLNAGTTGVVAPYITQIDSEVKDKLITLRNEFKTRFQDPVAVYNAPPINGSYLNWATMSFTNVARYYFGTVISQNFLNHYVHTLWRQLKFNYDFSGSEADQLIKELDKNTPNLEFCSKDYNVHLWPAVSPRTLLTPMPASKGDYYATTFFDDVRLCFEFKCGDDTKKINRIEFQFAAQAYTEIGFGSLNPSKGKLDILKISDRVFDIYFDTQKLGIQLIHPEIQSLTVPAMPISVHFDYSALVSLQGMFKMAMQFALASRNSNIIPRGASDSKMLQRYDLGTPAFVLVSEITPFRGNIYVNEGLTGVGTAIYDGALNIDTLDQINAVIIRYAISTFS